MNETEVFRNGVSGLEKAVAHLKKTCLANNASPEIQELVDDLESMLKIEREKSEEGLGMTAQVSIYPLRQADLSSTINEALSIFNDAGLEVEPGAMSTLIAGSDQIIWEALQKSFSAAVTHGEAVMIITISNACPWPMPKHPGRRQ